MLVRAVRRRTLAHDKDRPLQAHSECRLNPFLLRLLLLPSAAHLLCPPRLLPHSDTFTLGRQTTGIIFLVLFVLPSSPWSLQSAPFIFSHSHFTICKPLFVCPVTKAFHIPHFHISLLPLSFSLLRRWAALFSSQ